MNQTGKYQIVKLDATAVLILDTQEGHLWLWGVHKDIGVTLVYQGRISPGEKAGDVFHITLNDQE